MSPISQRYYAVCNRAGRILALLPVENLRLRDGVELGWRPMVGSKQIVVEVDLTAEYADLSLDELIEVFNVHVNRKTGNAQLRRRTSATGRKARRAR
jgi:hypothetical protein